MPKSRPILSLILVLGLLAMPVPAASQDSGPTYIVQPGDTLSAIARQFGLSQAAIINANAIVDPAKLFPGEALVLPGFAGIEGELEMRTLQFGETITSISRVYGIAPRDLARLNRMLLLDGAYAGQVVIVPAVKDSGEFSGSFGRLIQPGETRLELAAQAGISPWAMAAESLEALRTWRVPGTFSREAGEPDSKAFPSLIAAVSLAALPLVQGQTVILEIEIPEGYSLSGALGEASLSFFPEQDGRWVSLQGIHALAEPGLVDLRFDLRVDDAQAPLYGFHQQVLVNEGDYGFQILNGVPPETVDPAYTQPEEDLIRELLAPKTETKLWEGTLDYPSRYYTEEFASIFGTRRNYNNGALLYYHTGLDFYGQNVPIYAPAEGIVVFANFLDIRGNATYIDHGWGVYTGYMHQNEIYVEAGDRVERGQVIGLVGGTGRATGPHLHWEIWVGGVPVQPLDWVATEIP